MRLLAIAVFALVAAPASAAWHRASSPHFIIYADQDPAGLKAYAEKLERFDKAVRVARGMKDPPVGDGNRLTVFVVRDATDVQRLKAGVDGAVAGFYRTRAIGSIAVIPRKSPQKAMATPDVVFFHEYAHHLMFQEIATPMPPWLVEGFAEFMATAEIGKDGSVGLGGAPTHRAWSLYRVKNPLPFTAMLGAQPPRSAQERGAIYARGWLLAHYLTFSTKRRGQLEAYLSAMAAGRSPLDAARQAFGDIDVLERETEEYLKADKFPFLTLTAAQLPIGAVSVEPLSPGATALMPSLMRLKSGTDDGDRPALAARARAAAAPFPTDPAVQSVLAEVELYAGDPVAAEAAADRVLAARPTMVEALISKGRAVLVRAVTKSPGASFANARGWFMRANRIDPEDPEPLILYYQSYRDEKVRPTADAIAGLHYAADLAPQDSSLRLANARQYLADSKPAAARRALVPLAYNPHGGQASDEARRLIGLIDAGQARATPLNRPEIEAPDKK